MNSTSSLYPMVILMAGDESAARGDVRFSITVSIDSAETIVKTTTQARMPSGVMPLPAEENWRRSAYWGG